MKIGIVGAMAQEVAYLSALMENQMTTQIGGATIYQGTINGKNIALLQSGIGKVAAAMGTTALLQLANPDVIINTGSAGGVATGLKVGDVVISTQTAHHDVDVTAFGYVKGQLPNCPARFNSDENLTALAEKVALAQGQKVHKGLICSGDSFIHGGEPLAQIKQHFADVTAVEMEAAAIAQVCHAFNVPFVVVRAISDGGDGEASMSFEEFLPLAAKQSSAMVVAMIDELSSLKP
ncbi:5'-methylthioadenosine/adenosylhomocysteine nucleosidase [Avibacterium sp. 20-15]|uniref:5'-methylthioadenosine/adenosylhomocysteine nucleosidase n=1 Tax=unclassified Avibacterium TaxID=2685287 RepID=UPI002026F1EF|nr:MULTISPECIES: 5'-methylthioadenosine/adenosylhomocysteine nucleosidase [unclassified Avibacterium]MCW9732248.1 5'-methylthioadenosine/adenosylhomocysteine nucleosidase [Avibacterium sp. 20-15]URL05551.1 5'-methylthioadenosine/adenosylhomocysteine nucleosidase [Avibacterium sp. 20-132]